MAAGTVTDQDQLFYCDLCRTLFLSESDAHEHERQSGHATFQLEIAQG